MHFRNCDQSPLAVQPCWSCHYTQRLEIWAGSRLGLWIVVQLYMAPMPKGSVIVIERSGFESRLDLNIHFPSWKCMRENGLMLKPKHFSMHVSTQTCYKNAHKLTSLQASGYTFHEDVIICACDTHVHINKHVSDRLNCCSINLWKLKCQSILQLADKIMNLDTQHKPWRQHSTQCVTMVLLQYYWGLYMLALSSRNNCSKSLLYKLYLDLHVQCTCTTIYPCCICHHFVAQCLLHSIAFCI